jgi:hypothetical protein
MNHVLPTELPLFRPLRLVHAKEAQDVVVLEHGEAGSTVAVERIPPFGSQIEFRISDHGQLRLVPARVVWVDPFRSQIGVSTTTRPVPQAHAAHQAAVSGTPRWGAVDFAPSPACGRGPR